MKININRELLEDLDEKLEHLETETLTGLGAAAKELEPVGSAFYRQAVDAETQRIVDGHYDELISVMNAYRPLLKPLQPSDYPIELRLEYQKYILSAPIRFVRWLWERIRDDV